MDKRSLIINAITLNDIIVHKLEGIITKIEIVAVTEEDKKLGRQVAGILTAQHKVAEFLEPIPEETPAAGKS